MMDDRVCQGGAKEWEVCVRPRSGKGRDGGSEGIVVDLICAIHACPV